jgi:hypothetical protein
MIADFLDEDYEFLEILTKCILRETFEIYGPGLLCTFDVHDDFFDEDVLCYTINLHGLSNFRGHNCMPVVVLGL